MDDVIFSLNVPPNFDSFQRAIPVINAVSKGASFRDANQEGRCAGDGGHQHTLQALQNVKPLNPF